MLLTCLTLLTSCGEDSKEDQAQKLNEQATSHYKSGELKSALEVYQKSLDLYEDPVIRKKKNDLNTEIEVATHTISTWNEIKRDQSNIRDSLDPTDTLSAVKKLNSDIKELELIEAPKDTRIYDFLLNAKSSLHSVKTYSLILETSLTLGMDGIIEAKNDIDKALTDFVQSNQLPTLYGGLS